MHQVPELSGPFGSLDHCQASGALSFMHHASSYILRFFKWAVIILLFILFIISALLLFLNSDAGQRFVKNQGEKFLRKKLGSYVHIGGLQYDLKKGILLTDVELRDKQQKLLIRFNLLDVDMDVYELLRKRLHIRQVILRDASVRLYRPPGSADFNFAFIPAAFSSGDTSTANSAPSSFNVQLDKILLERVAFLMDDEYGKQRYDITLGRAEALLYPGNLMEMQVGIRMLATDSIRTNILISGDGKEPPSSPQNSTAASTGITVRIDSASLKRTVAGFRMVSDSIELNTRAEALELGVVNYNMDSSSISLHTLLLANHSTTVDTRSSSTTPEENVVAMATGKPFTFSIDTVSLTGNSVHYNNNAYRRTPGQFDANHILLDKLELQAARISYNGQTYKARLHQLSGEEAGGFILKSLKAELAYDSVLLSVKNSVLVTSKNSLALNAEVKMKSNGQRQTQFDITGAASTKSFRLDELLYFKGDLRKNKYFVPLLDKRFDLSTRFSGNTELLKINQVDFRENNIRLRSTAKIFRVNDPARMRIELLLQEFTATRADLLALLPKGTIPDSALHYIPTSMSLQGTLNGSMEHIVSNLTLNSTSGNVRVAGSLDYPSDKVRAAYDLDIRAEKLDLRNILQDSSFNSFEGTIRIKGKGFDPEKAVARLEANLDQFSYKGYNYHDVRLNASLDKGYLDATFDAKDPHLYGAGRIETRFTGTEKSLKADVNFEELNLFALGLVADSITWRGRINADVPLFSGEKIDGTVTVTGSDLHMGAKRLFTDTLTALAKHKLDSQFISINAPFLQLDLTGRYAAMDLPSTIEKIMNRYVVMNSPDTVFDKPVQATLVVKANIPDSIAQMLGDLKTISPFVIAGSVNTTRSQVLMTGSLPRVQYGDYLIDTLGFFSMSSTDAAKPGLASGVYLQSLLAPSFMLHAATIHVNAWNGVIDARLNLADKDGSLRYVVPVSYVNDPLKPYVQVRDSLVINKKRWKVNDVNRIYLDMENLSGSNLSISSGVSLLDIRTNNAHASGLPLELTITDFNLSDISDILIADTSLVSGMLAGKVTLTSITPLNFQADVRADSLQAMGVKLGTMAVNVLNPDSNRMDIGASLKGQDANLELGGQYRPKDEWVDARLDVQRINLGIAEPFIGTYFSKPGGTIQATLTAVGKMRSPDVQGQLSGTDLEGIVAMTGTYLKIPSVRLTLGENDIRLENVTLLDSAGNKASVDAFLELVKDGSRLGINVKGNNFEVVGRRRKSEQQIFGPTKANFNLKLNGSLSEMQVEGNINMQDGSELTYIYASGENDQVGEGLVEFFDPAGTTDSTQEKKPPVKTGPKIDVTLYLGVTPKSTITIITDEASGDQIQAKGKADLNFLMKPGSGPELLGTYVLDGGEYDITLAGLISKSFKIEKGSSITWSGDIKKGNADITAKYETKTTAAALLNDVNHIPGIDKQKLNFDVKIILQKELLKPDISFRLDMPEADQQAFTGIVYSRIKQINAIPAELNKQVMGLLAFNQFIAENPFNSLTSSGGDFQTQAFNTAGKLLTQELTNLVGRYVKDVDIDLGLEKGSDYTTGKEVKRTDLKLGLTRSFANNRLNVYVGSSFALEGANQQRDALSGLAGDVTMEYMLTPDGRYRLKGYRLTDNTMAFQGNVVRTGVSFVVVLEFNRFKNMFGLRKNKKRA